jgi:hypothetical protein
VGRKLWAGRAAAQESIRQRFYRTSRRDPTRSKPVSPIAWPALPIGSPASIARRESISNARSPCSSPAGTTMSPFASDKTPVLLQRFSSRLSCGFWATLRAIALAQQARERIERIPHANTRAYGKLHMALFELIRGGVSRAVPNALELGRGARENDLPLFRALAEFLEAWAKSQTAGSADAREEMSRAVDVLRERNIRCFDGPLRFAHAQEEARLGDPERAISIVDDALADFDRRGHRAMDAANFAAFAGKSS